MIADGDPGDGPGISVSDARTHGPTDHLVSVTGALLVNADGTVLLCDAIAESFPPQCAGERIAVEGFDPAASNSRKRTASGGPRTSSCSDRSSSPPSLAARADTDLRASGAMEVPMGRFRESVIVRRPPADVSTSSPARSASRTDLPCPAVEVVGGGPVVVGSRLRQHRTRNGRDFVLEFQVTAHEPPRRHVVEGTVFGVATTLAFLIEPVDDGSRVTMDADVRGRGLSCCSRRS